MMMTGDGGQGAGRGGALYPSAAALRDERRGPGGAVSHARQAAPERSAAVARPALLLQPGAPAPSPARPQGGPPRCARPAAYGDSWTPSDRTTCIDEEHGTVLCLQCPWMIIIWSSAMWKIITFLCMPDVQRARGTAGPSSRRRSGRCGGPRPRRRAPCACSSGAASGGRVRSGPSAGLCSTAAPSTSWNANPPWTPSSPALPGTIGAAGSPALGLVTCFWTHKSSTS